MRKTENAMGGLRYEGSGKSGRRKRTRVTDRRSCRLLLENVLREEERKDEEKDNDNNGQPHP